MTVQVYDTFSESSATLLSAHTPTTGGTWAMAWLTNTISCVAGADYATGSSSSGSSMYQNSTILSSADASALLTYTFHAATTVVGVQLRADPSVRTYYQASYSGTTITLERWISGTATTLGTYSVSLTQGTTYTLELICNGSTISVKSNGTTVISVTDTGITAAGRAGVICRSNSRLQELTVNTLVDTTNVSQTQDISYDVQAYVSQGQLISYSVASGDGTTNVSQTQDISYSVLTYVTQAQSIDYSVAGVGVSIISPALKNNTGTVLASVSGITAYVYLTSTGAAVVTKTGLTSGTDGVLSFSDAAFVSGTSYRIILVLPSTAEGLFKATAA